MFLVPKLGSDLSTRLSWSADPVRGYPEIADEIFVDELEQAGGQPADSLSSVALSAIVEELGFIMANLQLKGHR